MKTLLLTSFFLLTTYYSFTQDWQGDLRWVYKQDGFIPGPEEYYLEIIKLGDTIIQHRNCALLQERFLEVYPNGMIDTLIPEPHIVCYERDSMLYFETESGLFELLYNFDLRAGDTLFTYCPFTGRYVSGAIDSSGVIDVAGQERKVLWVEFLFGGGCSLIGPIIAGIGPPDYLFPRPGFVDPPPGGQLLCFTDGTIFYPSEDSCPLISHTQETGAAFDISIFPNPVNDIATIRGGIASEVKIFDGLGRCVRTLRSTNEVAFDGLPSGVYTLLIWLEGAGHGWYRIVYRGK